MAFNVLIVDDSKIVRQVIAKTLHIAGVQVNEMHEASNGQEALAVLGQHWIDLVFADINMPVMNGAELIERMSADTMLKSIPVVVVSTEGSATRIEQLKSKGISAYVRKPFTPEEIRQAMDEVMGGQHER
jgi:two-component system, chemotaxis family, chemotaxis protein CheY